MPESVAEPAVNPYISLKEDKDNAGRLKHNVAYQLHRDIRQEAKRLGLEIRPDDSPEEIERKNKTLLGLFNARSGGDLPDYQAAQIVDSEEKAGRDSLTGLLNRRGFEKEFAKTFSESQESDQSILFLMIDLDHFKQLNDTRGHHIGDQALRYLTRALTDSVEIGDLVGRWGGEEFVIAVRFKRDREFEPDKFVTTAERIRLQIIESLAKDRYPIDSGTDISIPITLSAGATVSHPGDTLEIICQRADRNLYHAKEAGRNQSFGDDGKIILTSPLGAPPETVSK